MCGLGSTSPAFPHGLPSDARIVWRVFSHRDEFCQAIWASHASTRLLAFEAETVTGRGRTALIVASCIGRVEHGSRLARWHDHYFLSGSQAGISVGSLNGDGFRSVVAVGCTAA